MPRQSDFTQEIADVICDRLANGESLRAICRDETMPSQSMVFRWIAANDAFREQYTLAREAQADALFDEILEIVDDGRNDWMASRGEDGNEVYRLNGEHVQRSKLRLDARKWMAGKLQPKKYGDKVQLDHAGEIALTPSITINGKRG